MTRYRLRVFGVTVASIDITEGQAPSAPDTSTRGILSIAEPAPPYDDGRQEQWQYEDRAFGFRA